MKILGIDFVPINTPLKDHLEALAALLMFLLFLGLVPMGVFTTIYLLCFPKAWPIVALYFIWTCVIDKDTPEKGGRWSEWIASWCLFKYVANYFPITYKVVPEFKLDPNRNYLNCVFPHGIYPIGVVIALQTNAIGGPKEVFPNHKCYGATLKGNFFIPFYRELLLALRICASTLKSLEWILSQSGGGHNVALFIGGAAESMLAVEGKYHIVLKNRKGFVKLALKCGSPMIPIFAFGQNSTFKQIIFPDGSLIRNIQYLLKKISGSSFPIVNGRGLFQRTFGPIPLRKPINIVVGAPIEVSKIEEPTQNDIDGLHQKFIDTLTDIFEEYKYEYEENPEECSLVIT